MESISLATRNLAPGCQIQKLPKRIGKEKGP